MKDKIHANKLLRYWRNSLIDATRAKGYGAQEPAEQRPITFSQFCNGILPVDDSWFKGVDEKDLTRQLSIYLFKVEPKNQYQHSVQKVNNLHFYSVILTVHVDRNGRLYGSKTPLLPRDILAPSGDEKGITVSTVDDLDDFLEANPFVECVEPVIPNDMEEMKQWENSWRSVVNFCKKMNEELIPVSEDYVKTDKMFAIKDDGVNYTTIHIMNLYENLLTLKDIDLPLLHSMAFEHSKISKPRNLINSNDNLEKRVGHMEPNYPLAKAQRDAASHFLMLEPGEVIAVNGPPGTGKTTMLQSIVATAWVESAINGKEPPIILACSANNQAVTNIIESFSKIPKKENDVLSGRWLPGIESLGMYYPSKKKEKEAIEKGYLLQEGLISLGSKVKLSSMIKFYQEKASQAFGKPFDGLNDIVCYLHEKIVSGASDILRLKTSWQSYHNKKKKFYDRFYAGCTFNLPNFDFDKETVLTLRRIKSDWHQNTFYVLLSEMAKSVKLFDVFNVLKELHLRKVNQFLKSQEIDWHVTSIADFDDYIANIDDAILIISEVVNEKNDYLSIPYGKKEDLECSLDALDARLDISIRYELFNLSTHYWEGRWLQEIRDESPKKSDTYTESEAKKLRYKIAKIAPCIISTFYTAPKIFKCEKGYLFNFTDILIVDEAGQVTPEIAMPTFSLAKRSIVVGDVLQIEPVWSVVRNIDIGNLRQCKIIDEKNNEETDNFMMHGQSASSGSIMKISQNASPYHYEKSLDRGMYLFEHRRCQNDIIEYCNNLCYKGNLKAMRGNVDSALFPAMSFVDVPHGLSSTAGTSRINKVEALTIALWIAENKESMTNHYNKDLGDIVAVVTPFSAQAKLIKQYLYKVLGDDAQRITVGTVHSLQGAERLVVLFSTVYTDSKGTKFFDRGPNILNVAVSRSKDSFIVFGKRIALDGIDSGTPSGLLLSHINHELPCPTSKEVVIETENQFMASVKIINSVSEHDQFLANAIQRARSRLVIVSPWLSEYVINEIASAIKTSVQNGVSITVYADIIKNDINLEKNHQNAHRLLSDLNVSVIWCKNIHSKNIIVDGHTITFGSFNWLSAQRKNLAKYSTQLDSTTVIDDTTNGEKITLLIDEQINSLARSVA